MSRVVRFSGCRRDSPGNIGYSVGQLPLGHAACLQDTDGSEDPQTAEAVVTESQLTQTWLVAGGGSIRTQNVGYRPTVKQSKIEQGISCRKSHKASFFPKPPGPRRRELL